MANNTELMLSMQLGNPTTFEDPITHTLGPEVLQTHVFQMIGTAMAYMAIKNIVSPTLSSLLFPKAYPTFSRKSKVLWEVGTVQMIKAPLNCALSIAALLTSKTSTNIDERVWSYSWLCASVQAIAMGFYLFEVLISLECFDVLGWPMLVHGIVSCGCVLTTFRPALIYYGPRFMLLELPVFFETFGNCLRKLHKTKTTIYRFNLRAMIAVYIFAKCVWAPYQLYYAAQDCWVAIHGETASGRVLPVYIATVMLGSVLLIMSLGLYWLRKAFLRAI